MIIGRARNDYQCRLDFNIDVLKKLASDLPLLVSKEYDKSIEKVNQNITELEKSNDEESRDALRWYYDLNLEEERDAMLKMLNEALVLVINAYYEKELKVIELASERWVNPKGSEGDSYVAKSIRKIKSNLQLSHCEEDNIAGIVRKDFTRVRNQIAHEIEEEKYISKNEVNQELLLRSLSQIHRVLDGFAVKIQEKERKDYLEANKK